MTRKPQGGGKGRGRQKNTARRKAKGQAQHKAKGPGKARARQKGVGKRPMVRRGSATTEHWLRRPETIRKLWIGGLLVLAGLVAVETWVYNYGYFGIDGLFAFNAWFGLASCVAMIVISNGLGIFLKREDTYYDLD